jgi:histidine ammonia-lyase
VRNVRRIVAGELLCAAQGIHTLRPLRSSPRLQSALDALRTVVPPLTADRRPDGDLAQLDASIQSGALADAAEVPIL